MTKDACRKQRRGANAIEFALTLPMFAGLVFGIMDYGWVLGHLAVSDYAAARGCRAGALVDPWVGDPGDAAREAMSEALAAIGRSCGDTSCRVFDEGEVPTRHIRCQIDMDLDPLIGLMPTADSLSTGSMSRMEWQRPR